MLLKNHSYSEKSNWIELFTGIGILYYYLNKIPTLSGSFEAYPFEIAILMGKVIVFSIVFAIILSIVFGLGTNDDSYKEDERDTSIRRRATTWAYWILNIGIVYLMVQLVINASVRSHIEGDVSKFGLFINIPAIDFMIHGLILLGFITQIAQNLIEIYFQRRGF